MALSDVIENLKYQERDENYIDTQKISVQNLYYISAVGDTPAFNGVIVMKNYFQNVPLLAPNISQLQNPWHRQDRPVLHRGRQERLRIEFPLTAS